MIGCESGSSVLDRRGEIKAKIQAIERRHPTITFEELHSELPVGWDDHQFFALSPRHFEAIMTKTCQVLVEGRYDGVLEPGKHYIALKRDFSNLEEVLDNVQDKAAVQVIAERAYEDIYLSGKYSYRTFASDLERALLSRQQPDCPRRVRRGVGQVVSPFAHMRSRLATGSIKAHIWYEQFKESLTSV